MAYMCVARQVSLEDFKPWGFALPILRQEEFGSLTDTRLLAMTFGRPPTISQKTSGTDIPAMIDDEYLLQDGIGTQPPHVPSRMGLFVSSLRLFDILDEILSVCYLKPVGVALSRNSSHLLVETLRLNGALDDLYESLPTYLKLGDDEDQSALSGPSHIILQINVLRCRFVKTLQKLTCLWLK